MSGAAGFFVGGKLTVSITPPLSSGSGIGDVTGNTAAVTAIASGGTGAYSFAWSILSSPVGHPITADSPAAAVTAFTVANVDERGFYTGRARVTVTSGSESATADVDISYRDRTPIETGGP